MKYLLSLFLLSGLLFLTGCGPELHGFNGTVNYDGQPVEKGIITFTPDAKKGNLMGASNVAGIRDGRYELPVDQGISGGWYKIHIEASERVEDAEGGHDKLLFPQYVFSHEFKPDEKVFNIEVPKQGK